MLTGSFLSVLSSSAAALELELAVTRLKGRALRGPCSSRHSPVCCRGVCLQIRAWRHRIASASSGKGDSVRLGWGEGGRCYGV